MSRMLTVVVLAIALTGLIGCDIQVSEGQWIEIKGINGTLTAMPVTTTHATRRRVEGTLGEGGPDLRLKTVNGSITLGPAD